MNFTVELTSPPDRDEVVAEIWWGDVMVAELHHGASGAAEIEIYPTQSREPWTFDFASWLAVLAEAQRELG